MDVLWAPWRMTYVGGAHEPRACIFCAAPTGDPRDRLLLGATVHSLVMLNRFPYQSGHLMVAPRRHTADLPGLSATEHGDLAETLRRALAAIDDTLRPEGFNLGMNLGTCAGAGFADHLHWHVVPYLRLRRGTSGSGRAEGCGAGWRGPGSDRQGLGVSSQRSVPVAL